MIKCRWRCDEFKSGNCRNRELIDRKRVWMRETREKKLKMRRKCYMAGEKNNKMLEIDLIWWGKRIIKNNKLLEVELAWSVCPNLFQFCLFVIL